MPGVEKLGLLGKSSLNNEILSEPTVTLIEEIKRPIGYAIPGIVCIRAVVEGSGITSEGWGTGSESVARLKATSEAIERHTMFLKRKTDNSVLSSNGWAAHFDSDKCVESAIAELVERDTALRTWFDFGQYVVVPKVFWPDSMIEWETQARSNSIEFSSPKVLLSKGLFGCAIAVLLQTNDERTVVGHASGMSLTGAIESAFFEALRSAHAALRFEDFAETTDLHSNDPASIKHGPGSNAMAYAYGVRLPHLEIIEASERAIRSMWAEHQLRLGELMAQAQIKSVLVGERTVVRAEINGIQDIFWGRTPDSFEVKNKHPHFVG